ncbi:MAG: sigma-E factor negative regulatory protein [Acidiferrobacter sp.]
MNERLSALVDAELEAKDRGQGLGMVVDDVEMRAAWGRYHVIRAVLRQEWDAGLSSQFSARVQAALAHEPLTTEVPFVPVAKMRHRGRQVARFALAASLTATAALFGLRIVVVGERAPASASFKTALAAPLMLPHSYVERAHWQGPRWRNRLNAFLLEHAAVAPLAGMNGLSYVRLAAYNGPRAGAHNKP